MSAPSLLPLPCPFCGVKEVTMMRDLRGLFWIECFHCNGRTNEHMPSEAEAIAAWNRRAEPSAWQPMETAPKDGSTFVVCDENDNVGIGYFDSEGLNTTGPYRKSAPVKNWQPLPAAPKVS